jgi:hypothetical protein
MEQKYNLVKTPEDDMLKELSKGKVEISIMRQMYDIMKDWDEEQQDLFIKCEQMKDWREWDTLYGGVKLGEKYQSIAEEITE